MWKVLSALILTVLFVNVRSFDYVEFKSKYCYEGTNVSAISFPVYSGFPERYPNGFVCENFTLTSKDLDEMAQESFAFTETMEVFMKNCEIEYFNQHLVSKFTNVETIFFENCKISFKSPEHILKPNVLSLHILGFHKCEISDNTNSLALREFANLQFLLVQNSTFENPHIDKQFLPEKNKLYSLIMDNTNVKSLHKELLTEKMHDVICTSCNLDEVESFFENTNNYLYEVSFANNSLTKFLSPDILEKFKYLPSLDLSGNQITESSLSRNHFKTLSKLENLNLSRNKNIASIGYLSFNDTDCLKILNMSRVNLKSLQKFGGLRMCQIDFSYNLISEVGSDVFQDLKNLKGLNLSHNLISKLDGTVFSDLVNLKELRLSHNQLKELPKDIFKSLINLEFLDLSYNSMKSISGFEYQKSILSLNLGDTNLMEIPSGFKPLPALKILRMSNNNIKSMDGIVLASTIEELHFSYNNITNYPKNDFQHLINLQYLDLSYNQLEVSKLGSEDFPRIRYIDLSGN